MPRAAVIPNKNWLSSTCDRRRDIEHTGLVLQMERLICAAECNMKNTFKYQTASASSL